MSSLARSMKQPALYGIRLTALLAFAHLVMDTVTSMPSGLLPLLQSRFELTESSVALLVATLSFSASVTQPLFGALSDRFSRRAVAAGGLILNAVLLSLVGVVPTPALLVLLFFIGGLGSGALHPAGASIVRAGEPRNKGLAVSLFSTGGTIGYALGPVIILYVVSSYGIEIMPWFMIPGVLLGIAVYFLTPADNHHHVVKRGKLFDFRVIAGPVGGLTLSGILSSLSFVTFGSAVPLWLVNQHGIAPDDPLIGWTLAAFTLAAALGGMLLAAVSTRIGTRWLISVTLLLSPVPLFMMFHVEPGSAAFFLTAIASGALIHASVPMMVVNAQNLAPHSMATASGMLMGFSTGIAGLLYVGVGRLQELIGFVPAMQIAFLAVIPAGLIAFYVLTKYRGMTS